MAASGSAAAAAAKAPKLTALRCVPVTAALCKSGVRVEVGDDVAVRGQRLARGQRVTFKWSKGQKTGKLRRAPGAWLVRVPAGTKVGTVSVTVKHRKGKRSNRLKLKVIAATTEPADDDAVPAGEGPAVGRNPVPAEFKGTGLWVVDLPEADGGTAEALVARARAARADTILLRLPNLGRGLGEFNTALVDALKVQGVRLCAWQYLFGEDPEAEAALALQAIRAGATCFAINAEKEYKGLYPEASRYMKALRAGAGADFPIGFSSFPIPGSHPQVPYSVFLGPGGAQVNLPQVYWRTADVPVGEFSRRAAEGNRIYGRPIAPLGQTYDTATYDDVLQFRSIWSAYGAQGVAWYRWGSTEPAVWEALAQPTPTLDPPVKVGWPMYEQGSSGDGVRWVQRLLASVDASVAVDGQFGPGTEAALRRFQVSRGLGSTGGTGPQTWGKLLELKARPE